MSEKEGLDGPHFFLLLKTDAQMLDDWQTMVLEGTGSKTFVVTEKFIQSHRFLDGRQSRAGSGPGAAMNKAPTYRVPRFAGVARRLLALAIGMARGVLAEWLAAVRAAHLAWRRRRPGAEHADLAARARRRSTLRMRSIRSRRAARCARPRRAPR